MYDLILVSQFSNLNFIGDLLKSINLNQKLQIFVILINQSESEYCYEFSNVNNIIKVFDIGEPMPLSKSRNLAIKFLKDSHIDYRYIMFPDDDAYYMEDFFNNFYKEIHGSFNFIVSVFDFQKKKYLAKIDKKGELLNYKKIKDVMSINMILSKESLIFFDEEIGLGTINGSSEDIDYFIRVSRAKRQFMTCNLTIGHPIGENKYEKMSSIKILKKLQNYSRGYFYVLAKHKLYFKAVYTLGRTMLISLYYLFRFQFRISLIYFLLIFIRFYHFIKFFTRRNR